MPITLEIATPSGMCGRFLLKSPLVELQQAFRFAERPNLAPRYNVAPTQTVPIVRRQKDGQGVPATNGTISQYLRLCYGRNR